jgi:magnesium transporter
MSREAPVEIRSFYLNSGGKIERDLSPERLSHARRDKNGLLWLDVFDPDHAAADFLLHEMGFHPLAVEDCMTRSHQPGKVDDFGTHMYLIVHGIDYSSTKEFIETARLSMFIAEGTVVTVHRVPLISLDSIIERIERDTRQMEKPSSLFSYTILDSLHETLLPALDHLGEVAFGLEQEAIEAPGRDLLQTILQVKRSAIRIQRTMSPQTRLFSRISRAEFPLIPADTAVYFRDLQDQVIQLDIITTGVRDSADNALATYLSSIGIKQNETMRILAIVAAVFLPLSLIAGIYGMNFQNMPELKTSWGYFAVLGVMLTIGLGTLYWVFFRHLLSGKSITRNVKPPMDRVKRVTSPIGSIISATDAVTRTVANTVTHSVTGNHPGSTDATDKNSERK